MIVLSLFDGMSCGRLALKDAGIEVNKYYASEIKEHGIKVTQENFKDNIQLGDVTKVHYKDGILTTENGNFEVGEIDLLIGGSPCQNFSVAMAKEHRTGLNGSKSELFYEFLRLLREIKPKHYLLENVKMDKASEKELNYYMGVDSFNINSKLFVGGLRNRLYWTNIDFDKDIKDLNVSAKEILTCGYVPYDKSPCLLESHSRPPVDKLRLTRRYFEKKFIPIVFDSKEHYERVLIHYNQHYKGLSAKEVDAIRDGIDNSVYDLVRVLDQNEMEKLQGVPVGYTNSISRNEAASLLGDGWTVPVISHIFKGLK